MATRPQGIAPSKLLYAFNDLKHAPYPSFLVEHKGGKTSAFRIRGLQGTEGDFVFDPLVLPGGNEVLVKLGDPVSRPGNPYNSYRLWFWNRRTNAFTRLGARSLFFPGVTVSPDGRRVAYIGGGDAEGTATEANPLTLYIYDREAHKETLVARGDGLRGGVAWLNAQTLLYTALPPFESKDGDLPAIRPNIFSFDAASQQSRLVIEDGTRPTPSPDGGRIAFFGLRPGDKIYPLSDEWWLRPGNAPLSVANSDGSGRKSYGVRTGPYPSLVWAPDNQKLFFVRQTQASPQAQASAEEWNVVNDDVRTLASLSARDAQETERSWLKPQFQGLGVSPDGASLFVSSEETTAYETFHTIQAINLADGKATLAARLKGDAGFHWRP